MGRKVPTFPCSLCCPQNNLRFKFKIASSKNYVSSWIIDRGISKHKILFKLIESKSNMKLSIASLLVASASAFAPSNTMMRNTALDAVSRKDSYDVTLLPGDGIGPEITEATKKVLQALCKKSGFEMILNEALIGGSAIDAKNDPFPEESLKQCLASDSVLLACIGGYKWDNNPRELRPETGLLKMRKEMGLFANLRPAKVLPQLIDASTLKREVVEGVDVMVVRELTGDVYFGTPKGIDVVDGKFDLRHIIWFGNMAMSDSIFPNFYRGESWIQ